MPRPILLPVLIALLTLGGCGSSMTKLDLSLTASQRLNPDLNGRPSPIVVRLIELKHPAAFANGDFFALYGSAKGALAADFVTQEELELRPGEQRTLKVSVRPGSRYVGVLAAYRDLPDSRWRFVIPVPEQTRQRIKLHFGAQEIVDGETFALQEY